MLRPLLLALALLPAAARGHEVLHEARPGGATAVRVFDAGGRAVAGAAFELFAPGERGAPRLRGQTDRNGWLAFVPDAPGTWRLRLSDASGHGAEIAVEVGAASPAPAPLPGGAGPLLQPAIGAGVVLLLFALLYAFLRRRRS